MEYKRVPVYVDEIPKFNILLRRDTTPTEIFKTFGKYLKGREAHFFVNEDDEYEFDFVSIDVLWDEITPDAQFSLVTL